MKGAGLLLALVATSIVACSNKADSPTVEQVAKAYEMYMNANLIAQLGQRVEVRGWDDLKVDCTSIGPERVNCVTGGTIDLLGFQGGEQIKPEPVPVPSEFDFTFAKQGDIWVPTGAKKKS